MEQKVFRIGEPVTAEFMTELVNCVAGSETKSMAAKTAAESAAAVSNAAQITADAASDKADAAFNEANQARITADAANIASAEIASVAQNALSKATELTERANSGEFNGANGVVVEKDGCFVFDIQDGELYLHYTGDTAPEAEVNENGDLLINIL